MTGDRHTDQSDGAADRISSDAVRAVVARNARTQARALTAERLTRAFWPLWTVAATFMGAALSGAFDLAPSWLHAGLLVMFAAGALGALMVGSRNFRRPTAIEALAALDEGTADRPVASLSDSQALGSADPAARAIWALHQRRLAARALQATPRPADLRLSSRDPFALRLSALILLVMGTAAAVLDGGERLSSALRPGASAAAEAVQPSIEAWATPPAYTGAEMIYLTERIGETLRLPGGARVSIRVYNAPADPVLAQDVTSGIGAAPAFAPMGEGAYDLTLDAMKSGPLSVTTDGRSLGTWVFDVAEDAAPDIAFMGEASASATHALQFEFTASDDYGISAAWMVVDLDPARLMGRPGPPPAGLEPIEIELPLPFTGAVTDTEDMVIEDLTEHPWAGLPVIITLYAEDAGGQIGQSAPMQAVIPARPFSDAMAKALVEERRAIASSRAEARPALQRLRAVTAYPEDWFTDTMRPYLIVRTAMRRLAYALDDGREDAEIGSVMELLWRAALLIEDGDLATAAERLRRAQDRLSEAIERGAEPDEIAQLMDELRQAMNDYIEEMARQAMENLDQLQQNGQPQAQTQQDGGQPLNTQDLQQMLDEIQRMAEEGDREGARRMMQALQQMLENLQMQASPGQQGQQGQGQQTMEELQEMLRSQQDLADKSFGEMQRRQGGEKPGGEGGEGGQGSEGQDGSAGQQSPFGQPNEGGMGPNGLDPRAGDPQQGGQGGAAQDMGQLAQRQEALRNLLEDLRAQLPGGLSPEAEQALRDADEAMDGARGQLEGGAPGKALNDQVRAMENLREGARQLGDAMRREAQRGQGDRAGQSAPGAGDTGRDPLGRPTAQDGTMDGADTRIPNAEDLMRARELLDEIRRRSGDRTRPELELDYLRRLLERF